MKLFGKILLAGGLTVVGLVVLLVALVIAGEIFGMPLKIEKAGKTAVVHVETLSEYPTTVQQITISEKASGITIFEAQSKDESFQIWNFKISQGLNPTSIIHTRWKTAQVITPHSGNTFLLKPGVDYAVTVRGDGWRVGHESVMF